MFEINVGTVVKTKLNVIGRVIKVISINTVRYYRLERFIELSDGRLQETGQWAFIQDREITHVRGWQPVQTEAVVSTHVA